MNKKLTLPEIVIIGAGPSGMSTSLFLAKAGIPHIILEKSSFPKDKICGDGLSGKVVSILSQYDPNIVTKMAANTEQFIPSNGIRFVAPNGKWADIPFRSSETEKIEGFLAKRFNFDFFLFQQLDTRFADIRLNTKVRQIIRKGNKFELTLTTENGDSNLEADIVIGAAGNQSVVRRNLTDYRLEPKHYVAGLRCYYENVSQLHDKDFIELHFLPEIGYGYFWIFPLPNGQANVGIGMKKQFLEGRNINLKAFFEKIIKESPTIAPRFKNAKALETVKGYGLPLGSAKWKRSGDGFLLTGDAGSLVDPFSGEGVGNALISGKIAAEIIGNAMEKENWTAETLAAYDKRIQRAFGEEFRISNALQKLVQQKWLFNFFVNRANKNPAILDTISGMYLDMDLRAQLLSPKFYWDLLFG